MAQQDLYDAAFDPNGGFANQGMVDTWVQNAIAGKVSANTKAMLEANGYSFQDDGHGGVAAYITTTSGQPTPWQASGGTGTA